MVAVLDGQAGAVKSDSIVSAELKEALKAAVKPLEDVPAKQQDWHPCSNEQVLDLVHPSLYPLIYARSRILADCEIGLDDCLSFCGAGEVIKRPPEHEADETMECTGYGGKAKLWSTKFQWLPAEVRFTGDSRVKMASYINNLHPGHHRKLYSVLEHVIAKVVPLWSLTLSMVKSSYGHVKEHDLRVPCPKGAKYAFPPETHQKGPDDYEDEGEDQENQQGRVLIMPQPREYREMVPPDYDLTKEFAKEGLQVIVKLANIVLTPDKPDYPGGSWHVEGSLNERICATALYYYDCENVTDSHLAFRQCIGMDTLYYNKQYGQVHAPLYIMTHAIYVLTEPDRMTTLALNTSMASSRKVQRCSTWAACTRAKAASSHSQTSSSTKSSPSPCSTAPNPVTARWWRSSSSIPTSESFRRPMCRRSKETGGQKKCSGG